ncbi:lambda family phage portal protein [Methylobacterium sp. PvP062]|uniref:Lambda family phage portal protein n=1 Tax=Methylobacterium radiotolerans TaxID=31998 RepID=A0ABV2NP87_9HYPH|nr:MULTISPECIES: phage portal protein [unclassified Methylobacterium]MBP2494948.1 lambda family phage portal protein [Methylobacterium sp. PvP105]MBP2505181.1 lambda family phage portal protein [Methylobacterium sp. PvP109]MCX7336154.1 phage portal protein [Hyphomicrobiales bacterium]
MAGEVKVAGPKPDRAGAPCARRRSYEAAQRSRNGDTWLGAVRSADAELYNEARTLRDKSRWLVRNNPYAAKATASLVSNVVGEGIVPRPVTGSPSRDRKIWEAFQRWSFRCDHAGQLDFYGLQALLFREMVEGGDSLIRRRYVKKRGKGDVPLELQLLEADFLDPMRNGVLREGGLTIQGVEIDMASQKRRAYWLYPYHPGNLPYFYGGEPMISAPVPAEEVLHVYELQRTQTRGVPWGTPAMEPTNLLSDYELAESVRKKTEACVVGFVLGADDDDEDNLGLRVQDSDGREVERFEPGMIPRLHGAKDVKFNAPTAVGGYGEYKTKRLQEIAAGWRMPAELISGDLSEVNFSSMRGGLVEFRRLVGTIQWQILIQMALQPIWEWWCEAAYLAGVIDLPYVPVEWSPPEFAWVDPLADAQTAAIEVRNGFRTWQDVVAEKGRNPDDVLDGIRAFNVKVDDLGIILDSDPRRTNAKGVQQPEQDEAAGEEPELSRPNRGATRGRRGRAASAIRPPGGRARGELRRGQQHDRDRLDHGRERPSLRLVGRDRVRRGPVGRP